MPFRSPFAGVEDRILWGELALIKIIEWTTRVILAYLECVSFPIPQGSDGLQTS